MNNFSVKQSRFILFATIILVSILLVSGYFLFFQNRGNKSSQNQQTINQQLSNSQFPLQEDGLGLYGFNCVVQEINTDKVVLSDETQILLSATCSYLDSLEKTQEITVPLTIYSANTNTWLISKYSLDNLDLWQTRDFKLQLEQDFFFSNYSENQKLYDEESLYSYDYNLEKKPNLDVGDLLLVRISKTDGKIYDESFNQEPLMLAGAKFNQSYHINTYGSEQINKFITTGRLSDIKLENNTLIPTFVEFLEDSNPS